MPKLGARVAMVGALLAAFGCTDDSQKKLSALSPATSVAVEEDCPADPKWFAGADTPEPSSSEPPKGDDCEFYKRAWQHFLRATDGGKGAPRFLGYNTYSDLFGPDARIGLLSDKVSASGRVNTRPLVLAPRLVKSAQSNQAEDVLQAGSNALLIDQNGHPIFYSIFLNPSFSDLIRAEKYNDLEILRAVPAETELPPGIVEFKAAWQIVDPAEPPNDRIVIEAEVPWLIPVPGSPGKLKVDTTRPLRSVTVALIALHVVFLPENHPEMVWATFEYDRNAPSLKGNPKGLSGEAVCVNPGEPQNEDVEADGGPYILYKNGVAFKDANKKPAILNVLDPQAQVFGPSGSVVRSFPFATCSPSSNPDDAVKGIDEAISSLNKSVKSQLLTRSWLSSYSLVGAVWQDDPRNVDPQVAFKSDKTFPDGQLGGENRLSSVAMESFTQTSSPNCFSCHDTQSKSGLGPKRISVSHVFRRFASEAPP